MKYLLTILLALSVCTSALAQSSKIKVKQQGVIITNSGDLDLDASAVLDVHSQNKGVVFLRLTAEQKGQITSPVVGLLIYNLSTNFYEYWNGTEWLQMGFPISVDPPLAPTGLSALISNSSQIDLTWTDNSTDETGFEVWRKTGASGTYALITTAAADATSYQDSLPMLAGDEYFYQVRAANGTNYSEYSSETSILVEAPPLAPANLVAIAPSLNQIDLDWDDVDGATYDVYRSTTSEGI